LAVSGWLGQGQDYKRFAGHRADVVVQAHDLNSGDLLDHRLNERLRRFDQMASYLLEQVSSLLRGKRVDQVLFGGGHQLSGHHHTARANDLLAIQALRGTESKIGGARVRLRAGPREFKVDRVG
jgi:hypothetical protein